MKFLIALSVLASTTVFAQDMGDRFIKCYEPAQQGEEAELAYKLKPKDGYLWVVKPFYSQLQLNNDGCLESTHSPAESDEALDGRRLELCRGQGQTINGYIPVEVDERGEEERTVYCEKEIKKWFYNNTDMM